MVAITSKALAVAALITIASLSPVWACLTFSGGVSAGLGVNGDLTVNDNGLQVCSGNIKKGDNNLDCINGYSLNYDYSDNPMTGPLPVTYCNIAGNCFGINIPLDCNEYDCCPSLAPCICYNCFIRGFQTFC
ncbi:hypothetical protein V8E54_014786 [Elaphomyces granulatus]